MKKKYRFVVFDFDGVVCDSTNECMVTAWNTWERWSNSDRFRCDLSKFTNSDKESFRKLRPYVRGAGEYYIVMRVLNSTNEIVNNQNDFDALVNLWKDQLKPFKDMFFIERNRLRKKDLDGWIQLHENYHDVIKVMKNLNNENRVLVATLKDGKSVRMILERNNIHISKENILDQSMISSKLEALNHFISVKKINKQELCFIDDNVTHLIEPKKHGFHVFLSAWGETLPEYKEKALKENISILENIKEEDY